MHHAVQRGSQASRAPPVILTQCITGAKKLKSALFCFKSCVTHAVI